MIIQVWDLSKCHFSGLLGHMATVVPSPVDRGRLEPVVPAPVDRGRMEPGGGDRKHRVKYCYIEHPRGVNVL